MKTTWQNSDGLFALFLLIIQDSVVYAASLGILILFARVLVLTAKRYVSLSEEATVRSWFAYSAFLLVGHAAISVSLYSQAPSLFAAMVWSMVVMAGLTVGLGLGAGILATVVAICYKLL